MQTFTSLAIDDDSLFLRCLETYAKEIEWINLKETFNNPVKGAAAILSIKPDVIFLDVEMPYIDGAYLMDWIEPNLNLIEKPPKFILVSHLTHPPQESLRKATGYIHKSEVTNSKNLEKHLKRILLSSQFEF